MDIEKYIKEHRTDFDSATPDNRVWYRIESQLGPTNKKVRSLHIFKYAAAILVFVAAGFLIGTTTSSVPDKMASVNSYLQTKPFLESQVNSRLVQLTDQNLIDDEVKKDLESLDEVYLELQKELTGSNYENSDVLIHAMIENYRTKIKILERILEKKSLHEDFEKLKKDNSNESF